MDAAIAYVLLGLEELVRATRDDPLEYFGMPLVELTEKRRLPLVVPIQTHRHPLTDFLFSNRIQGDSSVALINLWIKGMQVGAVFSQGLECP